MLNVIDLVKDVVVELFIKLVLHQVVVIVRMLHATVAIHILNLAHGHAPVLGLHVR